MAHAIQGHSLDMLDKRGAFRGQGAPSSRLVHSCFRPAPENGHNKPHQIKLYHQGELFQFKANFVRKKIINDMSFSAVWWIIEGMFIWFVSVISANCSRENENIFSTCKNLYNGKKDYMYNIPFHSIFRLFKHLSICSLHNQKHTVCSSIVR